MWQVLWPLSHLPGPKPMFFLKITAKLITTLFRYAMNGLTKSSLKSFPLFPCCCCLQVIFKWAILNAEHFDSMAFSSADQKSCLFRCAPCMHGCACCYHILTSPGLLQPFSFGLFERWQWHVNHLNAVLICISYYYCFVYLFTGHKLFCWQSFFEHDATRLLRGIALIFRNSLIYSFNAPLWSTRHCPNTRNIVVKKWNWFDCNGK